MTAAGGVDLDAIDPADADAGAGAVGQQPGQPDRRARRPRRRRRVGPGPRRAGVLRRVLRRVHVGRARPQRSSQHGLDGVVAVHSLSKRSNLAGGRVGFYAGDPELVALPPGGAQARRDDGARPGAGGRRRRPRRRRPRRGAAASATAAASSGWPTSSARWSGATIAAAGRRLLPLVPGRRRLGVRRAPGRRGRGARQPRRVLRRRPPRTTCASPWYNLTNGSSWSPSGWGCDGAADERRRHGCSASSRSSSASSAAVALWLLAGKRYDDAVADLAPAPIGCDTTLVFDRAGHVHVLRRDQGRGRRDRRRLRRRRPVLRPRRRRSAAGRR